MPLGFAANLSVTKAEPRFCAPPSWFRGAEGVRSAWPMSVGPFGRTPARIKGTDAQRAGLRFERKALKFLKREFGRQFTPSQWFRYTTETNPMGWCQVDGLARVNNLLIVFEVKTTFTSDAWWQLRKLYEPVVKVAYETAPARVLRHLQEF